MIWNRNLDRMTLMKAITKMFKTGRYDKETYQRLFLDDAHR